MDYSLIIGIPFFILFAHLIAEYIGRKREIGYMKTVFWCMMLSPIAGFFIALSSSKLEEEEDQEEYAVIENTAVENKSGKKKVRVKKKIKREPF